MPRNGVTRERVIASAADLVEQVGKEAFSMRLLAETLNIKTASLYHHVESMDVLFLEVCSYALEMQRAEELKALEGKRGDAAIMALAVSYRRFAKEHRELYRLIMSTAAVHGDQMEHVLPCIVDPFLQVLEQTKLDEKEKIHWQRVLRGIVHGFVSQEDAGFFSHLPADVEESFQIAVKCYMDGLKQAEMRKRV